MNSKNLRIIEWIVREGKKDDSTYRAPQKAFPVNQKIVLKEIDLSQFSLKLATFECLNKVNPRRNMFFRKIEKIAL